MSHQANDHYVDTIIDYCDEMDLQYPEWPERPELVRRRLAWHKGLIAWLRTFNRPDYEGRAARAMKKEGGIF